MYCGPYSQGLALVFSLSYAFVVPLFMISTWQSIFGNVREDRVRLSAEKRDRT